jgi:hypothetical protein
VSVDLASVFYNPGYGWYQVILDRDGAELVVFVSGRRPEDAAALTALVDRRLECVTSHLDTIRAHAAAALHPDHAADWVDQEHPARSVEQLAAGLSLGSVRFHPDDQVELTFRDGGAFWGHWVMVWLGPGNDLREVYLSG